MHGPIIQYGLGLFRPLRKVNILMNLHMYVSSQALSRRFVEYVNPILMNLTFPESQENTLSENRCYNVVTAKCYYWDLNYYIRYRQNTGISYLAIQIKH